MCGSVYPFLPVANICAAFFKTAVVFVVVFANNSVCVEYVNTSVFFISAMSSRWGSGYNC